LPAVNDEAAWRSLAGNPRVADHLMLDAATANVIGRYVTYHNAQGELAGFGPVPWSTALKPRLAALYTDPPGALAHLAEIRRRGSAAVCPMCGGLGTWSLDHVLPKGRFPEFYIFSRNLVPACPCNSLRNDDYKGPLPGQRILHPYYDDILERRLVRARFTPPFPAPRISIKICVSSGQFAPAVRFHVEHTLLKTNVIDFWTGVWASLLRQPRDVLRIPKKRRSLAEVTAAIRETRDAADAESGTPNNWRSMFYTGLLRCERARRFLREHINGIIDGSVNPQDF
jgi:hypothetical protein